MSLLDALQLNMTNIADPAAQHGITADQLAHRVSNCANRFGPLIEH